MKSNVSAIVKEKNCAGCGACTLVCARDAIKLSENEAGFYEAAVDENMCTHCGLCADICPRSGAKAGIPLQGGKLYALQSTDEAVVKKSSSGGIAHELSKLFIENGGSVIGAAYDMEAHRVHHTRIDDISRLKLLDGSKYLQSNTQSSFEEAIRTLKADNGASLLVLGTPCQISGLAAAAERLDVRERLLLVELFCHGVPSYRIWDKTVNKISKRLGSRQWDSVCFRYKKNDWHSYCLCAAANGKAYLGKRETEPFYQVFFENILLNDACWKCDARKDSSRADIRIGDYWGKRFMDRSDGVSAAFALTRRGRAAIDELIASSRVREFEPGTAEEVLHAQNMAGYTRHTALHDSAINQLRSGADVNAVVKAYRKQFTPRQKVKMLLLRVSAVLPSGARNYIKRITRSVVGKEGSR